MNCQECFQHKEEIKRLRLQLIDLKNRIRKVEGWKGEDNISIERIDKKNWLVIEHRKCKESSKVNEIKHLVLHDRVFDLKYLIEKNLERSDNVNAMELWEDIIYMHDMDLKIDEFNGGKNRGTYYNYYYLPIKILEHLGEIDYSGRGVIRKK